MAEPSRELLRRLTLAAGAPGAEGEVRDIVRETLARAGKISHDALGSILCEKRGTSDAPRVVLDCHLDEVGFMVQSITGEGRLKLVPLGSWWGHVLLAQRVTVVTERGKVPGVIASKPPHFLSPEERGTVMGVESMHVDVGATSREEAQRLGIQLGDSVVPACEFQEMATPGVLSSKAFDNRAGVGLMCEALLALERESHPNCVIGVGAVQEEIGCRGAATASELSRPDVAIVLEGTPADDMPGNAERQAVLGGGPQIRFYDPTAISNRRLARYVERVASEHEIPVQIAVRTSGGTDAKSIHVHRHGVPTVVVGVPARYIHTHVSLIQWSDYRGARELVIRAVCGLDAGRVRGFTAYGDSS